MGQFDAIFSNFFSEGLLCQVHYMLLIYVARWRYNVREIAVKNYEKSKNRRKRLCAPLRSEI